MASNKLNDMISGGIPDTSKITGGIPGIPDITGGLVLPDYEQSEEYGIHSDSGAFNALTDYELPNLNIESITIRAGAILDGIIVTYADGSTVLHGGKGGSSYNIALGRDTITRVTGFYGVSFGGRRVISRLVIETSSGKKYGPYGSGGGTPFEIYRKNYRIGAFFGSCSGDYIASLGAVFLK